jgi:hypothetical protein
MSATNTCSEWKSCEKELLDMLSSTQPQKKPESGRGTYACSLFFLSIYCQTYWHHHTLLSQNMITLQHARSGTSLEIGAQLIRIAPEKQQPAALHLFETWHARACPAASQGHHSRSLSHTVNTPWWTIRKEGCQNMTLSYTSLNHGIL